MTQKKTFIIYELLIGTTIKIQVEKNTSSLYNFRLIQWFGTTQQLWAKNFKIFQLLFLTY